jgi:hypothetical protein
MIAPLLLANLYSTWGLAAALAAICFVALRGNWFRQLRSKNAEASPEEVRQSVTSKSRANSIAATSDDLLRWQVEMHEMARDFKGEIDAKLLALQALMTVANEHSQRLEQLLIRANSLTKPAEAGTPTSGRDILDQIENGDRQLPPLSGAAQGRELLNAAQRKLIAGLAAEDYQPAEIAVLVGAAEVDVEWYLSLQLESARRTYA